MAALAGGSWLMQQNDGNVSLFHRDTQEIIVTYNVSDANATAQAQKAIYDAPQLSDEEKCFGHFWSGYFYRGA